MYSVLNCHNVARHRVSPGIITVQCDFLSMVMQGVSKRALQWYSKCCCVASVTKTFTLQGAQTTHDGYFVRL
jgi:hypothetical protein